MRTASGWLSKFGLVYKGRSVLIAAVVAVAWFDLSFWWQIFKGPVIS